MSWDVNNNLTSVTKGNNKIGYTYHSTGERRSKTVNGTTTTYNYNNGLLLSESTGTETLRYYYDSTGKVVSIGYQKGSAAEVLYFFARNGQGDVIAIYRNSDPKLIGTYEYDLWGRLISVKEASSGIDTSGILTKNPIRYRGYYYDNESGFYYLQSRYYDPGVRRFINADSYTVLTMDFENIEQYNLYSYCWNNPINMTDETGYWPTWAKKAVVGATSGAVGHRIFTGSWDGAGQAALDGGASGALSGAITGAISGGVSGGVGYANAHGFKIEQVGRLKPTGKSGKGNWGIKYKINKANGKPTVKSFEFHANHAHNGYQPHWQQNTWNPYNNSISSKSSIHWSLWGKRI